MKRLCILCCLLLLLIGCGGPAADGPIAYIPASPSAALPTVGPTSTAAPMGTPTPVPTATPEPTPSPTPTPVPMEVRLRLYVEGMTDREKIGQLVMFGFSGTNSVSDEFAKIMADYAVGNVILYGSNISRA